jgi:hypothetical protein
VASERTRILAELNAYRPLPTIIVDSGGGYQGLWRLDEPHFIGGTAERWEEIEAYSRQLGIDLDGDNTWNIDRILRVAGTVNWPDSEKVKKGREARLAAVAGGSGEAYPLATFTPAPVERAAAGSAVSLPSELPRADLDALPAAVTPRTRMLIVQGDDPDDPTRYASKSEVMWAVTCELIRAGCKDEQIAAVLLDPDLGISDHPLRQKRSMDYVVRQIERARADVAEPMLRELNEKHAVIALYGNKTRVASWQPSALPGCPDEIVAQSFEDFRNFYMNVRVQTGTDDKGNARYAPAGKWWLEHPLRRQYRRVIFDPAAPAGDVDGDLNVWSGLAVTPRPGAWPLFRRLIEEALAGGDPSQAEYIMRWCAFAVQRPGERAEVALTLIGGKGTGKGTFGRVLRRIFGPHGVQVAGAKSITNNFNKHLHSCCLLFADEAVAPGDRNAAGIVKSLITEDQMMIEPKGVDAFAAPNRLKVLIASNDAWVVEASEDERRYAVFHVSPTLAYVPEADDADQRRAFWSDLNHELENGGVEAFLHDLLALDLGDWHPRHNVPQTGGLTAQKAATLRGFERVWYGALRTGIPPGLALPMGGGAFLLSTTAARDHCHKVQQQRTVELNDVAALLGEGRRDRSGVIRVPGLEFEKDRKGNVRGYLVPGLAAARERWDGTKWPGEWGDEVEWELDEGYEDENGPPY